MNREETAYFVTSYIFMFFITLCSSVGYGYVVKDFLFKKKNAFYVGAGYFVTIWVLCCLPWQINHFLFYLLGVFVGFMIMYFCDRRNIRQKLFLAIVFYSIRGLSYDIVGYVYTWLYELTVNSHYFMMTSKRQFLTFLVLQLLEILMSSVVLFYFLRLCRTSYQIKEEEMSVRELVMLSTPCIAFIAGREVLSFYQIFYEEQLQQLGNKPYDIVGLLYSLIAILTIAVVIIQFQKIKEYTEEQRLRTVLREQLLSMQKHTAQVEKLYGEIRGLKHDMGNHIQTIKGLLVSGNSVEAEQYSERLIEAYQTSAGELRTGHPVTDVLLAEKEQAMRRVGIVFQNEFHFPVGMGIDVFDISILLNNALDNAIEACEAVLKEDNRGSYFIHLCVHRREHIFLIKLLNTCKASSLKSDTGNYLSSKGEAGHGFGLKNMQMVAEKYMGTLECEQVGNTFQLVIMLQEQMQ